MHRDRFATLVLAVIGLSLVYLLWRAWDRAAEPPGSLTTADAAWATVRVAASFAFLGVLALAARRLAGGLPLDFSAGGDVRFRRLVALALSVTLAVGMSGGISALAEGAGSHPLIALAGSLVLLRLVSEVRQRLRRPGGAAAAGAARSRVNQLHALVFAQLALGTLNTLVTESVAIQLVHLLLAYLVWIALVLTCAASLAFEGAERPQESAP